MGELDGPHEHAGLQLSRRELLALGESFAATGARPPDGAPIGAAHAAIVGSAHAHASITVIRPGDIRRAEVWLSPVGVVQIWQQDDDDRPAPVIGLPPDRAYALVAACTGLGRATLARPAPLEAPSGLGGLVEQMAGDGAGGAHGVVFDWTTETEQRRWIVIDLAEGRVGTLDAPAALHERVTLVPLSPMALAGAIAGAISDATSSPR